MNNRTAFAISLLLNWSAPLATCAQVPRVISAPDEPPAVLLGDTALGLTTTLGIPGCSVHLFNGGPSPVHVAIGFWNSVQWVSKGWYTVEPGDTTPLLSDLHSRLVYWYAMKSWQGPDYSGRERFCIARSRSFELKDARARCHDSDHWRDFNEFVISDTASVAMIVIDRDTDCRGHCEDGEGRLYRPEEDLIGTFKNKVLNGPVVFNTYDTTITGVYRKNARHGWFVITDSSGYREEGEYRKDRREGVFNFTFNDSIRLRIRYRRGLPNGLHEQWVKGEYHRFYFKKGRLAATTPTPRRMARSRTMTDNE